MNPKFLIVSQRLVRLITLPLLLTPENEVVSQTWVRHPPSAPTYPSESSPPIAPEKYIASNFLR